MATREMAANPRSRIGAALIALAFAGAVLVLVLQANSIRSTGTTAPTDVAPGAVPAVCVPACDSTGPAKDRSSGREVHPRTKWGRAEVGLSSARKPHPRTKWGP